MEEALIYELSQVIPGLDIYPTNAPENVERPYLVYIQIGEDINKTLDGHENSGSITYMFSCMATRYADMKSLTKQVRDFLLTLPRTSIGEGNQTYIKDVTINNIAEQYEHELKVNRGIIDFTIYY